MGATAFNRARRLAAEKAGKSFDDISYEEAIEILSQPETEAEKSATVADLEGTDSESKSETVLTRDDRETELKALNWEALRDLLKSYELPTNKPKGVSWDDFAIPQILEHEGF